MSKPIFYTLLSLLFVQPSFSYGETLVLIHGYLSDSRSWHQNKVTQSLHNAGWRYAGNYRTTLRGISTPQTKGIKATKKAYYTVDLPADAAIEFQVGVLGHYLQHLYAQRQEPLILVGHSAGGVIARSWLTKQNAKPTKALITIASPHLGTPLAGLASIASKTPLVEAGRMMGLKNFRKSKGVYADLKQEQPGNYIHSLNRQQHPPISYVSIIRNNKKGLNKFDFVVPVDSQNMNNISALEGKSATLLTDGDHFLTYDDGVYINDLVDKINKKK